MIERIERAMKRAIKEYKNAYEFEPENFEYIQSIRDHIRELYWIVNGDPVNIEFDKSKITIKYSNGTTREY